MLPLDIRKILKENRKHLKMLEDYDRTGEFALDKTRKNFTLRKMTARKLKAESGRTGRSMSSIIDSLVDAGIKD